MFMFHTPNALPYFFDHHLNRFNGVTGSSQVFFRPGAKFHMEQIWPEKDETTSGLTKDQQVAFRNFKHALTGLVSAEGVKAGTIWKCKQRVSDKNPYLGLEGKLQDVLQFLKEHPLASRHYFRCSVVSSAIIANLGFNKARLEIRAGKPETPIVLYIREGTKHHVCAQTLEDFAYDTRIPERRSRQIVGSFGRCEILERLGNGSYGEVYKVQRGRPRGLFFLG